MSAKTDPQMDDLFPDSPEDAFDDGNCGVEYEIEHGAIPDGLRYVFNHSLVSVAAKMPEKITSIPSGKSKLNLKNMPNYLDLNSLNGKVPVAFAKKALKRKGTFFASFYETLLMPDTDNPKLLFRSGRFVTSARIHNQKVPISTLTEGNYEF